MSEEKKYLLQTNCNGYEEHEGEQWISEEEFNKIKQRAGTISTGCEICKLTIKDEKGTVLFTKEGC